MTGQFGVLKLRECCAGMALCSSCVRKFGCKYYFMQEDKGILSENLRDKLRYFIQDNDALRASRNIRRVFFDYLKFQDGMSDTDFDKILIDIEATISLLEFIADESNEWRDKISGK